MKLYSNRAYCLSVVFIKLTILKIKRSKKVKNKKKKMFNLCIANNEFACGFTPNMHTVHDK